MIHRNTELVLELSVPCLEEGYERLVMIGRRKARKDRAMVRQWFLQKAGEGGKPERQRLNWWGAYLIMAKFFEAAATEEQEPVGAGTPPGRILARE